MTSKKLFLLIIFAITLLLGACAEGGQEEAPQKEAEQSPKTEAPAETEAAKEWEPFSFHHVHGLAFELTEPYDLYLGTHHGVIHIDRENIWTLLGTEEHQHDVMGFNFHEGDTMISSGHPNPKSNLKNPIGVIISTDKAQTWEPIALHGEVDFHFFEINASDSGVLYGLDMSGLYRSTDGGATWEMASAEGLPGYQDIFSFVSDPGQPTVLLAGTKFGVYQSENSGDSWQLKSDQETLISAKGVYGQAGTIVAYVQGKEHNGLMRSSDFGATWTSLGLSLEDDAVAHIAVHPVNEEEYAVGTYSDALYRTVDGGKSWNMIAKEGTSIKE